MSDKIEIFDLLSDLSAELHAVAKSFSTIDGELFGDDEPAEDYLRKYEEYFNRMFLIGKALNSIDGRLLMLIGFTDGNEHTRHQQKEFSTLSNFSHHRLFAEPLR